MEPQQKERDPAGLVRDDEVERRQLARRLIYFVQMDWKRFFKLGAFAELGAGEKALFLALVGYMNDETIEAFPSQETLAAEIDWSVRSVQDFTKVLKALGIINEPRVLHARGVLHYELGPATYAALREFRDAHAFRRRPDHDAEERIEHLERENAALREAVALGGSGVRIRCRPATTADRLPQPAVASQEANSFSRSEDPSSSSVPREEQESISISEDDKSAARSALVALNAKRFKTPVPLVVAAELVMVARCAALIAGTLEQKREALEQAIAGAISTSKGAPTAKYVFADAAHFRDHLARAAKVPKPKPRELEPVAPVELVPVATMLADVAQMFGPPRAAAGGT